jgi:cutinase
MTYQIRLVTMAIAALALVGTAACGPLPGGATGSPGAGTANAPVNQPGGVAPPGDPAWCPDVGVVFARGTGEAPGLGGTGTAFVTALRADLPGRIVTSYAVNYDASDTQTNVGLGATDLSNHVISVAGQCPQTRFVIGGYSQGASVVDVAIGVVPTAGLVTTIPVSLASRIAAVVVFGNPLGDLGHTIASLSPVYGPKSDSFCNAGDPVCGRGFDLEAHLAYATDGSAVRGAQFAAEEVGAPGP